MTDEFLYARHSDLHACAWSYSGCAAEDAAAQISLGAAVDAVDKRGDTPLHVACQRRNLPVIEVLLKNKCSVNALDAEDRTPLMLLAWPWGDTPCEWSIGPVQMLLGYKADTRVVDKHGDTALHLAAATSIGRVVKLLLGAGADPDATNLAGLTPFDMAFRRGIYPQYRDEVILEFVRAKVRIHERGRHGETLLHRAASRCSADVVQVLLDRGEDINATTDKRNTALHYAAASGAVDVVQMLVDRGADVNAITENHKTALHLATVRTEDFGRTAEILTRAGADINACNDQQQTPLHLAVRQHSIANTRALVSMKNIKLDAQDMSGNTPLHEACSRRDVEILTSLVEAKCNVTSPNATMRTPLHVAVKAGFESVIEMLVDNGAEVDARDTDGNTALHIAVLSRDIASATELVRNGASISILDNIGHSPIYYAEAGMADKVVKLHQVMVKHDEPGNPVTPAEQTGQGQACRCGGNNPDCPQCGGSGWAGGR